MASDERGARLLAVTARRAAGPLGVAVAAGLVYQVALVAMPWFLERAVDQGVVDGRDGALRGWALAVLAAGVAAALAEMALGWFSTVSATREGNRLYIALADRVSALNSHARYGEGDLSMRGTRDVDMVRTWLMGVPSFVTGVVGLVLMVAAIMRLDPLLAGVLLLCSPPLVFINAYWFPRRFGRADAALSAAYGERADAVEELLSASAAVRGLGGEAVLVRRHEARSAEVTERALAAARVAASWAALSPLVPALAVGVGLAVGGLAVLRGAMSVGGIVAFTGWTSMLVMWVGVLTMRLGQLGQALTAARRLQEVLRAEDAVTVGPPTDFAVQAGEFVAVTGPMASGKTTLLRALGGLAPDSSGPIHERVGFVPQRPVALSGTIADNLRLGGGQTDEELYESLRVAALDEYVRSLPDGLGTDVGEGGTTLSGGQLQRLALARALLREPAVLLLDDVTSAVDTATERAILERLRAHDESTAIVWATHRPNVLGAADRVLRLEPVMADG